jgi:hypothetical protein
LIVVIRLSRHCTAFDECCPSFCRDPRNTGVGFCLIECRLTLFEGGLALFVEGLCLLNLLIQVGSFDNTQNLTGMDVVAYVDQPLFQITVGPGYDRGLVIDMVPDS